MEWLDHGTLQEAYTELQSYNKNEMWWNWKPLPYDHPLSPTLRSMEPPPLRLLTSMGEDKYYKPKEAEELPSPATAGMTEEQWSQLPRWQRLLISSLQSPLFGGVMGGLAGLPVGAALGGNVGGAVGLLAGGGLGAYAQTHPESLAASLMLYLDMPREWVEQGLGTISQVYSSLTNPEDYGKIPAASWEELTKWLGSAWQAGHIYTQGVSANVPEPKVEKANTIIQAALSGLNTGAGPLGFKMPANLDVLNKLAQLDIELDPALDWLGQYLPGWHLTTPEGLEKVAAPGEVWMAGKAEPILAPDVTMAMYDIRQRILDGEQPNAVIQEYIDKYGLSGNMREMAIGFVIDPINYFPLLRIWLLPLLLPMGSPRRSRSTVLSSGLLLPSRN